MSLKPLFKALASVFDGGEAIERSAGAALLKAQGDREISHGATALQKPFLDVMAQTDAHPVCDLIARTPLPWAPPQTSDDPDYIAHSQAKVHVELLGPNGLVKSDSIRLGLYGILPHAEYGIRTHPAEEIFIMLAGKAYWKRGQLAYSPHRPNERSHHPSMMPHATRTGDLAFLSAYAWCGEISTQNYRYQGIPKT